MRFYEMKLKKLDLNETFGNTSRFYLISKVLELQTNKRTYDYAIGIRAVTSVDGVTSDWAKIPWDVLEKISARITTEVPKINRVLL